MQSIKTCVPYIFEKLHKKLQKTAKLQRIKCKKQPHKQIIFRASQFHLMPRVIKTVEAVQLLSSIRS